jgi:hypothetical protein
MTFQLFTFIKYLTTINSNNSKKHYLLSKNFKIRNVSVRSEELGIGSPIVLGCIGGVVVIIILMIWIYVYCYNANPPQRIQVSHKKEQPNQIDLSIDQSKAKICRNESKLIEKNEKVNDNSIIRQDLSFENKIFMSNIGLKKTIEFEISGNKNNNKLNYDEKKREILTSLDEKKIERKYATMSNSKNPIHRSSDNLVGYTNDKLEYPTEKKVIREIYKIDHIDIQLQDFSKNPNSNGIVINKADKISYRDRYKMEKRISKDENLEDEEYEQKEQSSRQNNADKNNLQPLEEDIISDFKERTKNFNYEIFKKSTLDFEEESIARRKSKKKKTVDFK